jgi:4-diphosphocytidyl-2-C-methyl-D-erythritol kinase
VASAAFRAARRAHAKLNLRLEIGRAAGRLHPLVSVIASLELADILEFSPAQAFGVSCPGYDISESDNLVFRAARALDVPLPKTHITIRKQIPLQAGLGGGSADAAAALLGIAALALENGEVVSADTLRQAAANVGSDVPSALIPGLKIVAGTGEIVTPYPCRRPPEWGILLLKPKAGSDTARAYALLDEAQQTNQPDEGSFERARAACAAFAAARFDRLAPLLHNDFSHVIEHAIPGVQSASERMADAGALHTLLCGSGSCVAGFFETVEAARAALGRLPLGDGEWSTVTRFHV